MGVKEAYERMKKSSDRYKRGLDYPLSKHEEDKVLNLHIAYTRCMDILAQECPEVKEENVIPEQINRMLNNLASTKEPINVEFMMWDKMVHAHDHISRYKGNVQLVEQFDDPVRYKVWDRSTDRVYYVGTDHHEAMDAVQRALRDRSE